MKKILILALVVVGMLAFATAAYANVDSTYAAWDAAAPNDNPPTPHKGYQLNTNKCAVCHAVHKGDLGGEVLLRSTVANACNYCHIDSNIGGNRIYGGDATNLSTDVSAPQSFGGGFAHNIGCSPCHSVHGAQTIDGNVSTYILKDWNYAGWGREYSTFAIAEWPDPDVGSRDAQETNFCTGCHKYYTPYYADGNATTGYTGGDQIGPDGPHQSHVMTTTTGGYNNGQASLAAGTDVAWAGSTTCRACHDSPNDAADPMNNSWPHYTRDYYRFMVTGAYQGDSSTNTTGTVDGLCIKCHINSSETSGVGIDF